MNDIAVKKKHKYKNCVFKSLLLYTVLSFLYIAFVALSVTNSSTAISSFAGELLRNLFILLLFSFIFGFSTLIFNIKRIPGAAKWTLHVVLLYASMLAAFLLMAGIGDDPSSKVKFIFISTMLFAVVYSISVLVLYIYRRKKHNN